MVADVKMLENFQKLSRLKRYRWPLLVLAIGVLLLLLPSGGKTEQRAVEETAETDGFDLEAFTDQLEALLGNMQGVGRVQLLLSLEDGGETIYQMDFSQTQSTDSSQNQSQTVLARTGTVICRWQSAAAIRAFGEQWCSARGRGGRRYSLR